MYHGCSSSTDVSWMHQQHWMYHGCISSTGCIMDIAAALMYHGCSSSTGCIMDVAAALDVSWMYQQHWMYHGYISSPRCITVCQWVTTSKAGPPLWQRVETPNQLRVLPHHYSLSPGRGVNVSNLKLILLQILAQILQQTTTNIPPPTTCYVPKRNKGKSFERPPKIFRGL